MLKGEDNGGRELGGQFGEWFLKPSKLMVTKTFSVFQLQGKHSLLTVSSASQTAHFESDCTFHNMICSLLNKFYFQYVLLNCENL